MGMFNMGSTIVMIAEVHKDAKLLVNQQTSLI